MSLNITVQSIPKHPKKILVEMDAEKFERLAAGLGLFSGDFIDSVTRAERDYKNKRYEKIESLKDLK
ncbi:MAG: hypothetical protein A2831_02405 [Candidatus Yanofskybacteria bacterium RIFCSPHIGHO2_01_FULL_44_17]|uniref:Uncharacterized protein n=1 Tax=Candidatus Yanofskybacteria bacterium RIFCSPHIGHO2_01_FULL_44_17 TaxID=1802668 RepID=A0A1F8EV50_9BACT|nr:MAG: hypothetical protein A2831_02405 [Candidatus Yanofskybacteria bacterium RIFCSPHIGHO2_01_FULL_44_17]